MFPFKPTDTETQQGKANPLYLHVTVLDLAHPETVPCITHVFALKLLLTQTCDLPENVQW